MADAYFTTTDGVTFVGTDHVRGPWDPSACHAGPPTALLARASEQVVPDEPLVRLTVEIVRPIPMSGFRIDVEPVRLGRIVSTTRLEMHAGGRLVATASGLHLADIDLGEVPTHHVDFEGPERAIPGPFPIREYRHGLPGFGDSLEVRYHPALSRGDGGETFMWARGLVPFLADEEPSPFQRVCPLADSGNGISWHEKASSMSFLNADLVVAVHRRPTGEWIGSHTVSYWEPTGIGRADAELFDASGTVGRAMQNLVLRRP